MIRPAAKLQRGARERGAVDAAVRAARNGAGRVLLVSGEPGVGKTRLAEWAAETDRGKYAARSRLAATAALAFTQVDITINVRWHTGLIIRRSWVRAPPAPRSIT
jgi:MoxR-like ATPase